MIKRLFCLVSFFAIVLQLASPAAAGQVVTDELHAWARKVISQEMELKAVSSEKSVAVLYFSNQTGDALFDPLQKGLALMLITDLSKVEGISVVERVRLQALIEELKLSISGLASPETSPRLGRLLQAYWIVGGDLEGETSALKLDARVLEVLRGIILGRPVSQGRLAEVFKMEKEILFEIIKLLKVKLKPVEIEELKRPMSTNIAALMFLFRGIDASDQKDYEAAASFYEKAIKEDEHLDIARDALNELKKMGLIHRVSKTSRLLRILKEQTSLTDRLIPEYPVKRVRSPQEVQAVTPGEIEPVVPITPNLPPDYGAPSEPSRPANQPGNRPGAF